MFLIREVKMGQGLFVVVWHQLNKVDCLILLPLAFKLVLLNFCSQSLIAFRFYFKKIHKTII